MKMSANEKNVSDKGVLDDDLLAAERNSEAARAQLQKQIDSFRSTMHELVESSYEELKSFLSKEDDRVKEVSYSAAYSIDILKQSEFRAERVSALLESLTGSLFSHNKQNLPADSQNGVLIKTCKPFNASGVMKSSTDDDKENVISRTENMQNGTLTMEQKRTHPMELLGHSPTVPMKKKGKGNSPHHREPENVNDDEEPPPKKVRTFAGLRQVQDVLSRSKEALKED